MTRHDDTLQATRRRFLIDTAALYLDSRAERIVGRALRERPELAAGVVVETKCCRLPHGSDYTYDGAMRSVEGSLERLQTDHVELRRWLVDAGFVTRDGWGHAYARGPAQLELSR